MSETILKILASELSLVRIRCKNGKCQIVTEVHLEHLDRTFREEKCPVCGQELFIVGKGEAKTNFLEQLQTALVALASAPERFDVEFVLPVKSVTQS